MGRIEDALEKADKRIRNPSPDVVAPPVGGVNSARMLDLDPDRISNDKLVAIKNPASPEAEEFRKLKKALMKEALGPDGFGNVIMITSATPREGKSLVTLNLAASLAQEYDHTVLVVDADLRKPTCHIPFGIVQSPGLSDYILDGMSLDKVLVRTGIGKLVLLPAGRPATNLCEMYSSNTMRGIIQEMKHRYPDRIILIDTPPILTFAETRILADQADAVILVVRERQCSKNSIQECMNLINNKLLGIVYNGAETKDSSDFYYYYYLDEKQ